MSTKTMRSRRVSVHSESSAIPTSSSSSSLSSSRAIGRRAPLSDIRERLSNLKNTTKAAVVVPAKPSSDIIWQKSVALAAAAHERDRKIISGSDLVKESSVSLDVDALLLRRAKRKELRGSILQIDANNNVDKGMEQLTPKTSLSKQHEGSLPASPPNEAATPPRLSSLYKFTASPQQRQMSPSNDHQSTKSKAALYETGIKLKSAEERIDHLMKDMEELRIFATVSAQFQHEEVGQQIKIKVKDETLTESLQTENQRLLSEKATLEATIETYQKQMRSRDEQIEDLQLQLSSSRAQLSSRDDDILQQIQRESALELEATQCQLIAMSQQLVESQARSQSLKDQLDEIALNYAKSTKHLRASLEDANRKIETLEIDRDVVMDQMTNALDQKNKQEVEAIEAQYSEQIQAIHFELESLKSRHFALESSIQSKDLTIENLSNSLADAEMEWHALQQRLRSHQSDNSNLQENLCASELEKDQLVEELHQWEEVFDKELQSRCESLQLQLDEQRHSMDEHCNNLKAELSSRDEALQESRDSYEGMVQRCRELESQLEEIKLEKEDAQIRSEEAKLYCSKMKHDLGEMQRELKRLGKLEESYKAMEHTHVKLQHRINEIQNECDLQMRELDAKLRESEQNCEKLQADLDASERENDELAHAIEEIEEQNSAIEGMVETYENDLDELKLANQQLESSLRNANIEKDVLRQSASKSEGEKDAILAKLANKNLAYEAFKEEFGKKFAEMKDQYSELERELDQAHSNCTMAEDKVTDVTMEINNLASENSFLRDDRNSLKAAVESCNKKIIEMGDICRRKVALSEQKATDMAKRQDQLNVESRSLRKELEHVRNSSDVQEVKALSASHRVFGITDENSINGSFDREHIEIDALQSYMAHRQSRR